MNTQRTLALVVGQDSPLRHDAATELIDRGFSVVLCGGPPRCPLLRGDWCPLASNSEVAVFLPEDEPTRVTEGARHLCAKEVGRAVAIGPVRWASEETVVVESADPETIADAVAEVVPA